MGNTQKSQTEAFNETLFQHINNKGPNNELNLIRFIDMSNLDDLNKFKCSGYNIIEYFLQIKMYDAVINLIKRAGINLGTSVATFKILCFTNSPGHPSRISPKNTRLKIIEAYCNSPNLDTNSIPHLIHICTRPENRFLSAVYVLVANKKSNANYCFKGSKKTLLLTVIECRQPNIAIALINAGADVDAMNYDNCGHLATACKYGFTNLALLILSKTKGLDIYRKTLDSKSNLTSALAFANNNTMVTVVEAIHERVKSGYQVDNTKNGELLVCPQVAESKIPNREDTDDSNQD